MVKSLDFNSPTHWRFKTRIRLLNALSLIFSFLLDLRTVSTWELGVSVGEVPFPTPLDGPPLRPGVSNFRLAVPRAVFFSIYLRGMFNRNNYCGFLGLS